MRNADTGTRIAALDATAAAAAGSSSVRTDGALLARVFFFSSQIGLSFCIAFAYYLLTVCNVPITFVASVSLLLYSAALLACSRIRVHRIAKLPKKQRIALFICSVSLALSTYLCLYGLSSAGVFRAAVFRYSGICIAYAPVLFGFKTMTIGGRRLSLSRRPSAKRRLASIIFLSAFALLGITSAYTSGATSSNQDRSSDATDAAKSNALSVGSADPIAVSSHVKSITFFSGLLGCLSLALSSFLRFIRVRYIKSLSKDSSTIKRLRDYSVFGASVILAPFGLLSFLLNLQSTSSTPFSVVPLAIYPILATGLFLSEDFIPEVSARIEKPVVLQAGYFASTSSALVLSLLFGMTFPVGLSCLSSAILIFLGLRQMTGSSISFLPRYMDSKALSASSQHKLRNWLNQVMDNRDTRRIFEFLCLNFLFTFVEVAYGYWTNSLGLISDAVHMLFDCTALLIGLYASTTSRLKANDECTFGFGRYEVLSGFVNGIFLVFISVSVFVESIQRVINPPNIRSEELLTVSILGLLVNLVGIFFFHDSHGHSHGLSSHNHSHSHGHSHNTNMEGIFLHIVADALGSVGVIISSLMVHYWGWLVADPICSIIISGMIAASVYPLLRETSLVLLQMTPKEIHPAPQELLHRVTSVPGVLGYRDAHFWCFRPGTIVCSLYLQIEDTASGQEVLNSVNHLLRSAGISEITVQIEKSNFVNVLEPEVRTRYHMHDPHFKPESQFHDHCSHGDAAHGHSHS